jgi:hypothetical protein
MHKEVVKSMKASGFHKVRLETYSGAHDPYPPHTTEALNWFVAEANKSSPAKRESDFDKFFKKARSSTTAVLAVLLPARSLLGKPVSPF